MELNKIYNMDCFELFESMPDDYVDIVFTSPPYNSIRHTKYEHFEDKYKNYHTFLVDVVKECLRVAKKYVILNVQANYYNKTDVYKFIGDFSKNIQRIVIWNKTNPTPSSLRNRLTNSYEFFFILSKKETVKCNSVFLKDVITFPINSEKVKGHSAVMNKDVCELFIKEFTQENEIVFDPFSGTGTTAIVCKENNRKYIGTEIEKTYYDYSISRIKGVENEKYMQESLF